LAQVKPEVAIVGAGYVGLPLGRCFAEAGVPVVLVDIDAELVETINRGESHVEDVPSETLAKLVEAGTLSATTNYDAARDADAIVVALPTPLSVNREPDLSIVLSAARELGKRIRAGQLVSLESTTYPGTTRELLLPSFEARQLVVGEDFFLCFSPERVDPGNAKWHTKNTPKVIGGITERCTELGELLYRHFIDTVVRVSSPEAAELTKLLENTFRMINIGLANEIALMCDRMGINVWEVIDAAATKPFGFMPFYPGPGLGGHCIPIDPFYLSWKTKQAGIEARFIELAGYINGQMPHFVVDKIQNALNDHTKPLKGSRVHVMGVAYKRDIDDVRESPALDIIHLLGRRGAAVSYSDPFVPQIHTDGIELKAIDPDAGVRQADCVVIVTDHKKFDYPGLVKSARLIVDTRNALKGIESNKIVRL
jgi:UDP-N-acetyl-D-glucosamine dehydrogenase